MTTLGDGKKCGGICGKLNLKPFTKNNILYYYFPMQSLISYGALSMNVMNPSIAVKLLPKRDLTNFLLIHSIVGSTLYIYSRPHLQSVDNSKRLAYSLTGGALFSFGSVLIWAVLKSTLPKDQGLVATVAGLASGFAIVKLTTDYFDHVDGTVAKKQ